MSSPFTCAQGAIDAAVQCKSQQAPEDACDNLTAFWIDQGVCFTSGHVVHAIRQACPSMAFSQARIGRHLRGQYGLGQLPDYADGMGGYTPVVSVVRVTTRTDTRTPVGHEVFVYGPTEDEANAFEFEINIAEAPVVSDGLGGTTSAATAMLNATPSLPVGTPGASNIPPVQPSGTVAVAHGKMAHTPLQARVHADGRLCIPRIAFEALAFVTGKPVVGGVPLYAAMNGNSLWISQQPFPHPGPFMVTPTTDRLRLHIAMHKPFPVGTEFEVKVIDNSLGIVLD